MKLLSKLLWYSLSEAERYQWMQQVPALNRSQLERLMKGTGCAYPPAFHSHKCIFVHIPKTAGTSITNSLFGKPRPGHQPLTWYESLNPSLSQEYFKFAFVRNPWDRLVSGYFHMIGKEADKLDSKEWGNFLRRFESFEDFVLSWVSVENVERQMTFIPQYQFVINKYGMPGLDFIGHFENIQNDYAEVCNRLGVACELPHKNKAERGDFRDYYTPETRDIVAKAYARDIAMFKYEFD